MPPFTSLKLRRTDGVAWVTIDRPPLNVFTIALLDELDAALSALEQERDLRLIVLEGAGRVFSAGVDVAEHRGASLGPMLSAFDRVAGRVMGCEVPVLAVVHGAALGGACELVVVCDLALVAEDAKLGTPEITLGVVPPVGAALFARAVGPQRAAALVLTGEAITGKQAAEWGLVWKAVPADALRAETERVVASFASKSAAALRLAKRTFIETAPLDPREAVAEAHRVSTRDLPTIEDADEGLRAFLEKRAPAWRHR